MRAAGLLDAADVAVEVDPVVAVARVLAPSRRREASMAALIFWPTDLIIGKSFTRPY
jgi:hypothetical protein